MKNLKFKLSDIKLYYYLRLLSIDVVIGSACTSLLFFFICGMPISIPNLISIALVVWIIYTLDHLYDAKQITIRAILPRHRFHQENFIILSIVCIVTILFSLWYITRNISKYTILYGLLVFALVVIHFFLLKKVGNRVSGLIQKEIGIALIFSLGTSVPALSLLPYFVDDFILMVVFQVFLVALINLLEFSYFEVKADKSENQTSFARAFGQAKTKRAIYFLISLEYLISVTQLLIQSQPEKIIVEGIFLLMGTFMLLIIKYEKYFSRGERFRIWGDGVFFIPITVLFL